MTELEQEQPKLFCEIIGGVHLLPTIHQLDDLDLVEAIVELVLINEHAAPIKVYGVDLLCDGALVCRCREPDSTLSWQNERCCLATDSARVTSARLRLPLMLPGHSFADNLAVHHDFGGSAGGIFEGLGNGVSRVTIDRQPACQRIGWLIADLSSREGRYSGDWAVRAVLEEEPKGENL